jgi:hypothetical protein
MQPGTKREGDHAMTEDKTLDKSDLRKFSGSENWYRHGINRK